MPSFILIRFVYCPSTSRTDKIPATTNIPIESNLNQLKLGLACTELSKCSFHLFPSATGIREGALALSLHIFLHIPLLPCLFPLNFQLPDILYIQKPQYRIS